MLKNFKFAYAYCDNCEKEVKPKRKPIDGMYINVWILLIISSLGFGIIPFLIYRYLYLKKNLCSICNSQVEFYALLDEIPEPKSQIIRILKTIEDEKKIKEEDSIFCPFCQKGINTHLEVCPNCGSSLKK
ncbi:hypothetical protein LCGC14_1112160 [marine sediment metagenome]|uniref:LITAF domain-containing protein n=1 Tax=marine sediment metagenome TaxID=412755 RepID=A0A0F9PPI8_9ZZZZ